MRKTIAILLLIMFGSLFYLYTGCVAENTNQDINQSEMNAKTIKKLVVDDYEGLLDRINDIQQTPDQVVKFYALLNKELYSGELDEKETEEFLKLQRKVFHQELLNENPENVQLLRTTQLIEQAEELDVKLIEYDILSPEFIGDNNERAIVKAVFYRNKPIENGEVYQEFLLQQKESLWYIMGWRQTEEFTLVGD